MKVSINPQVLLILSFFLSPEKLSPYKLYVFSLSNAIKHGCWKSAMDQEIATLEKNKVWILTEFPAKKQSIGANYYAIQLVLALVASKNQHLH
ncbi:hypothetical protein CR513_42712, partial [Mucuna pruriens]